jgi:hypothetical protein
MPTLLSPSQIDTVAELLERCDACNAAAKLVVTLTTGGELAFCGHHANRMVETITKGAAQITLEEGYEWAGTPTA